MADSICGTPDNLAAGGNSNLSMYGVWDAICNYKTVPKMLTGVEIVKTNYHVIDIQLFGISIFLVSQHLNLKRCGYISTPCRKSLL